MKTIIYSKNKTLPAHLVDNAYGKFIISKNFNHVFKRSDGFSATWGASDDENPDFSPYGPLIADIEITTICEGPRGIPCSFCYKANTGVGSYMSFDTYKKVFEKLPKTIGQIAFGVDASGTSNPDMWDIFQYTKDQGVVPNLTIADISDGTASKIASTCGACAVSLYDDKDLCYDNVKKLTDLGMTQVNIHFCYHSGNIHKIDEIINDIKTDPRLAKLNAIVFLALKQKGRGKGFNPIDFNQFELMIKKCFNDKIRFGMDSCSAGAMIEFINKNPEYTHILESVEPCESTRMSLYIDVNGDFFPCSFMENIGDWKEGISVIECENFIDDVWFDDKTVDFRNKCVECNKLNKGCQYYNINS